MRRTRSRGRKHSAEWDIAELLTKEQCTKEAKPNVSMRANFSRDAKSRPSNHLFTAVLSDGEQSASDNDGGRAEGARREKNKNNNDKEEPWGGV